MKKISLVLPIFLTFYLVLPAFAAKNNGAGESNQQVQEQNQQGLRVSVFPTGNQVQNRNEVQTQNQGEDLQLQVNTQERQKLKDGSESSSQNRDQNAVQNMSEVAKQIQELQQVKMIGGIGEQVRQIAQEQNQAQIQIQEQLTKLESKGKLARLLTGTDYGAVKSLKQQLEQNQLRLQQLIQLQNQLTNQGDITVVQETIRALTQENISLQERISTEEQTRSLLGWLFKLFLN